MGVFGGQTSIFMKHLSTDKLTEERTPLYEQASWTWYGEYRDGQVCV